MSDGLQLALFIAALAASELFVLWLSIRSDQPTVLPMAESEASQRASALLDFLESDFGQSGRDVQIEAVRCEIEAAFKRGQLSVAEGLSQPSGSTNG